ncbi:intraflagellar transport protein 140 homolog [Episyrphus balteatus]|uniref:intraflagellar transport protein 140 homolog n=1 Tax=Episyrphus balteatus TaxID=286459 RepID=UPI00248626F7|nr:intraflagellar transport protein 140 homolog [Episyrphus balteatus]
MTLYFDSKVQFLDSDAVSTIGRWHPNEPIFAVASYSQDRGGSVTIFDDSGEPLRDISYPVHPISQATALSWHPEKRLLVTGWENGELHAWFDGHREFASVQGPHKAPIILLEFSEKGGRMVTADSVGLLTGWRCDGQYQFLTMFSHDLRDALLNITFRKSVDSPVRTELTNLAKAAVAGDETALDTLTNWRPRTAARNLTHSGVKDNHCFYVGTQSGVIFYINQGGTCSEFLKSNTVPIIQVLWHPKRDAIICLMEDMTVTHFLAESSGTLTELDRVKLSGKIPGNNGFISWAGNCLAIITGDFSIRIWDIDTSENFLLKMDLPSSERPTTVTSPGPNSSSTGALATAAAAGGGDSTSATSSYVQKYQKSQHHQQHHQRHQSKSGNEVFTCLAYCPDNQTLCAGTNQGNLYTWKRTVNYFVNAPENSWQLNNISTVRGAIKQCFWGVNELAKPCIMINCISNVYVLKEQPLISCHTRDIWAVQRSANQIYVEHSTGKSTLVQAEISITTLALSEQHLALSNGRTIVAYRIGKIVLEASSSTDYSIVNSSTTLDSGDGDGLTIRLMQTFSCECLALFMHDQSIFCLTSGDVKIFSIGGVILNEIQSSDSEGKIIGCDLTSNYLTIFTMSGYIKVFDVTRHDPKPLIHPKSGYDLFENFGEVILAKCNAVGSHLAVVIANESLMPDGRLYCWDFERDIMRHYDFMTDTEESVPRLPIVFFWDTDDSRLLAIEARSIAQQAQYHQRRKLQLQLQQQQQQKQQEKGVKEEGDMESNALLSSSGAKPKAVVANATNLEDYNETQAIVMFHAADKCTLKVLEMVNLASGEQLVNLCAPNVITLDISVVKKRSLQDFIGLENCDENTRKMVLNFSLNVAEGNMDLAYRCIRSIQSEVVWTNLAKMCVQTGRLDVAKVCLGHLKKARSVRAIRQAMDDDDLEKDAKVAVLAVELGMIEEAQELYKKCGRFDLLNKLLQSCGAIDEALKIAEKGDRVHLKNTYFQKGEQLKEEGNIKGALEFFEKSQNPVQNITQMLLDHPVAMKQYMQTAKDPKMLKWWGQYIESTGDMDGAFTVYQKAEDWFSQVKILCYLGQISKADVIARQSGDRAACYHLARHYENIGKHQEAIQFYTRAQTYANAIRICKENDMQDELWTVASSARQREKSTAAAYFEEVGSYKRAVELYHRSGMLHKALEMAFASEQPDILQVIASELTPESDPELINRCAEFFTTIEQHQKAVHLLAKTKQFERSLRICHDKGVPITESLAEMLTPTKTELDDESRARILTQLGELLQEQGDYHSATKKFTQAGDKIRAMKSLLKSGDTDKIVFFANMSRQREVYIMAANYLQALNWHRDQKVLKNIVTFYSKGQAFDSLANFYATCAQVEIDEFRDYEKALKAMHEAAKCLVKVPHSQRASDNLQKTIVEVKYVLDIQEALENGENQAVVAGCRNMLIKPEIPPIRHADVLAMLVKALANTKQYVEAVGALRELALKDSTWSSRGLIEKETVQKLADECNLDFNVIWESGRRKADVTVEDDDEEEIKEEIK